MPLPEEKPVDQASPVRASRVLVVDDDESVREVMAMVLEGLGYQVLATGNGFEALRRLQEETYDLLVLDARMPDIDGPTLYREVLARWPMGGPRVLFVTGFSAVPDYLAQAGNVPLLIKPFTLDEMKAALDRVLAMI